MGELFRRFWLPAILTSEVAEPDCPPVRLKILGENLVAFRDTSGRIGIVQAYCSHRCAPLYFGRNEDGGLRCIYHGWKFDVDGNCLETPNVPADLPDIRKNVGIPAYPVQETNGVAWVYMGPAGRRPPFPAIEHANLPDGYTFAARWLQRTNWSQGLEGEIDSSHISWLHRPFDKSTSIQASIGSQIADDGAPHIEILETPYGFVYGARRNFGDQYMWRVTQFMWPMFSLIPREPGDFVQGGGRAWVPIDDDNTTVFTFGYRVDHPIEEDELNTYYRSGAAFPPRLTPGVFDLPDGSRIDTFLPVAHRENDYQLDRDMQRTVNFSGIWGVHDQDRALAEGMRPMNAKHQGIIDRSAEHLVSSDRAVVLARRQLLSMADALAKGIEPDIVMQPEAFGVRAISKVCAFPTFAEFMSSYGDETSANGVEVAGDAA
jgi:phenylpropionate dioxygenase-like ring-hydroxylating dioxygenase large terminal subunit